MAGLITFIAKLIRKDQVEGGPVLPLVDADQVEGLQAFVEAHSSPLSSTDQLPQGTTNLYFTQQGVRDTPLSPVSDTAGLPQLGTPYSFQVLWNRLITWANTLGTGAFTNTGTGPTNTILGNDSRLTNSRTPTTHASTHLTGGSDPIQVATDSQPGLLSPTDHVLFTGKEDRDVYSTLTYSSTMTLDFNSTSVGILSLAGNVSFTSPTTNKDQGKSKVVYIKSDSTSRTLSFPSSWIFLGVAPLTIPANKTGVLSLVCLGTQEGDVVAAYSSQA